MSYPNFKKIEIVQRKHNKPLKKGAQQNACLLVIRYARETNDISKMYYKFSTL